MNRILFTMTYVGHPAAVFRGGCEVCACLGIGRCMDSADARGICLRSTEVRGWNESVLLWARG